jgi:hypothetical protein
MQVDLFGIGVLCLGKDFKPPYEELRKGQRKRKL